MTAWRKACGANNGCVEVSALRQHVGIRDSTDPYGPVLVVDAGQWRALINSVKENHG